MKPIIESVVEEKHPNYIPFYANPKPKVPRLPLRDNKVIQQAVHAEEKVSNTYVLEKLLSEGSVNIKTNFRMK